MSRLAAEWRDKCADEAKSETHLKLEGTAANARHDDGEWCGCPGFFLLTLDRCKHYLDWTTFTLLRSRLSFL